MIEIPRRIILGPGPSSAHPKVLSAMSNSVIGYLDPDFFKIKNGKKDYLKLSKYILCFSHQ